jgi:hypothetical protein
LATEASPVAAPNPTAFKMGDLQQHRMPVGL